MLPAVPRVQVSDLVMRGRERESARPDPAQAAQDGPPQQNAGWAIFSYLLSGMIFYGLIGWVISRVTHLAILFPVGMLAGLATAILLIVLKYGRP
jgi:F0F1-type ATP synthase assembly protein I